MSTYKNSIIIKIKNYMKQEELINQVREVIKQKKDSAQTKNFNVFKLLKLEHAEDKVHSAFIGNLLNPKGTHNCGDLYLKLFLKQIGKEDFYKTNILPYVKLEEVIGRVDLKNKTGGIIDIYLRNSKGETICIENKINAGLQPFQLERYLNHNKENNYVVFLNLKQEKKVEISEQVLSSLNFKHITYANEIICWLEECKKVINANDPLFYVLEAYLEIVYEITEIEQNMETKEKLKAVIFDNIIEAKEIYENYQLILDQTKINFQNEVFEGVKQFIDNELWSVQIGNKADKYNAQIWIKPKEMKGNSPCFGIESFSGRGFFASQIIIGVFCFDNTDTIKEEFGFNRIQGRWLDPNEVSIDNDSINFNDDLFISKIEKDLTYRELVKNTILNNFQEYFEKYKEVVLKLFYMEN